jgi:hypothetical protein
MVTVLGIGIMFVTLYVGITQGFSVVQVARENLRATQILEEKMETIRLYRWSQVTDGSFVPATFTAPFFAVNSNDTGGLIYQGDVMVTNVNFSEATYSSDLREVIVRVRWVSGSVPREREMRTLVSQYGMQQYIY